TTSSFRFRRRDSSRLSWRGPRPGPIAATVTEHRRSPDTSWPEWSPLSATARRDRLVDGLAIDFVVESDRAQLGEIVARGRDGRLRTNIGIVSTLDDHDVASNPPERRSGKTIIHVRP